MRKSTARRPGHRPLKAGGAAAAAAVLVLAGTATPASAAITLSTSQVAIAGGTVLYLTGGTALADTMAVRFVPQTETNCPAAYDTAVTGAVNGGLIDATSVTTAHLTTPALPAGTYKTCIYASATTGALVATETTANLVTAVNIAALSPTTGQATEKITLTGSSAIFTGTSYTTQFVAGTECPALYTAPLAGTRINATSTVKVAATTSVPVNTAVTVTVPGTATVATLTAGTPYHVCSYGGTTAGTTPLAARSNVTFASFDKTLPAVTVVPTGGSSGEATNLTLTAPTTTSPFAAGVPSVLATRNSCPLTRPADAALGAATGLEPFEATVLKITNSKVAVTLPDDDVIVGGKDVTTPWNLCAYASDDPAAAMATAPAVFTVAAVLDLSGAQFAVEGGAATATGSGPAQGGQTLTVSGLSGIPTAAGATLTASLGGSPITNITVVDATSFTGTTTAHAPGPAHLSVTTSSGTKTTTGTPPYTFTYGINLTPNTAPTGTSPVLDITGAGFGGLTFGDVATGVALVDDESYVLLTDNAWNDAVLTSARPAIVQTGANPVSYCNGVLPISDAEIICTLNLEDSITGATADHTPTIGTGTEVLDGTYTVTVVNDGQSVDSALVNFSAVSSSSTFTVASF
ncbi:hypothetical protein FHR83_000247 [Actinoplanes campanulatus]|uniref:IPT/TIG domain-containing protein n=1 Tax=Actinoplanes campanulatus TaxID=113559 RepID=A0A7W5AAF7_9ACTN|nr:hypothetical protein [Actinoplanes campanulatus]MBB3092613.1 hypothetical protein [Actinoplanes campanulatus]GGM97740.1 hypothetical protein GCM10010109_01740 [Actinoplanes campanulatus]GID34291.1 hypothetical protein Aca09nite_07970 [Actinoplanes campanulatus]